MLELIRLLGQDNGKVRFLLACPARSPTVVCVGGARRERRCGRGSSDVVRACGSRVGDGGGDAAAAPARAAPSPARFPLSLFILESIDTSPFMCTWQIHGSRMPLFRLPKRRSTFAAHPRLNLSDGTTVLVVPAAATLRLVVELLQLLHVRAAPSPGRPSICARQP